MEDVNRCIAETGVDGVMSAEALLENPALFGEELPDLDDVAKEYLDIFRENNHESLRKCIRPHLFKFLHAGMKSNPDLRTKLGQAKYLEEFEKVVTLMKSRRKGIKKEDKFGWYERDKYRKLDIERGMLPQRIRMGELS